MTIQTNLNDRKELARQLIPFNHNEKLHYTGTPAFAYEGQGFRILRSGDIECDDEKTEAAITAFLQEAVHIADMIMERVKTDDLIPYWDYDAPAGEKTPRDASAAAVTASAFLELSTFVPDGKKYSDYAETILKNLSGPKYLAAKGSNQGYVLMHSTGSLPHGSEIDVPLNYADYYYMEALKRYIDLKNKR